MFIVFMFISQNISIYICVLFCYSDIYGCLCPYKGFMYKFYDFYS